MPFFNFQAQLRLNGHCLDLLRVEGGKEAVWTVNDKIGSGEGFLEKQQLDLLFRRGDLEHLQWPC